MTHEPRVDDATGAIASPTAKSPSRLARSEPRPIEIAWTATAIMVPVIVALWAPMSTVDLAYHLRLGDEILKARSIPITNTLTFPTYGAPWVDQQWGAQVVLEVVNRVGGWPALVAFRGLLVGVSFFLVNTTCRRLGAPHRTSAILTLGSFLVASSSLALRPQLLVVPLVCLTTWLLVTAHSGCRRLLVLPLIAWVAAAMHGAFLIILVIMCMAAFVTWIGRSASRSIYLGVTLTSILMTFLTPLGTDLWSSALRSASNPALRQLVVEWQPPSLRVAEGWLLLISLVAVVTVVVRSPASWRRALPLLPFLVLALSARRGLLWWALLVPVVLAPMLRSGRRQLTTHESRAPATIVIGLLFLVIVAVEPFHRGDPPESLLTDAPMGLARASSALEPGARLFAFQSWASWLEFAAPDVRQFVDSRLLVDDQILEDYATVEAGDGGWTVVMDRWQISAVAAPPDWPVVAELRRDEGWSLVHEDAESILFLRRD